MAETIHHAPICVFCIHLHLRHTLPSDRFRALLLVSEQPSSYTEGMSALSAWWYVSDTAGGGSQKGELPFDRVLYEKEVYRYHHRAPGAPHHDHPPLPKRGWWRLAGGGVAVVGLLCAMLAPTRHCIPSFDLSHPDHRETLDGSVPDLRRPPDLRSPPDLPPPCTGTCAPCTRPEELLPAPMVSLDKRSVRLGSSKAEVKWALNRCQELAAAGLHRKCQRFEFEINPHRPSKAVAAFELDKTEITNRAFAAWLNQQAGLVHQAGDIGEADENDPCYRSLSAQESGAKVRAPGGAVLTTVGRADSGLVGTPGCYHPAPGHEEAPAVWVTWEGAQRFCASQGKRLPTESEWERAARPEGGGRYPWGDDAPRQGEVSFQGRGRVPPRPVGASPQDHTAAGLMDLGGSVREWLATRDGEKYLVRGGDFCHSELELQVSYQITRPAERGDPHIGFRCARSVARALDPR